MIQILWAFDFLGIFLSRLIVAYLYFIFALELFKSNYKAKSIIYFVSSLMIGLGILTSIVSLFWIIFCIVYMIKNKTIDKLYLALCAYFIILISVGAGLLSLDRFFDIRF